MPVFFAGRLWVSPATISQVDDSAMYNRNANVGNVLAIIGKAEGGQPLTPLRFKSPQEAASVLRSSLAIKAVEKAFDPSSETGGPADVVFIRVDPATQSTLALKNGSAATVINLTSTDYGRFTNQIKVKVEAGSVSGKKVTTQLGNAYYSADNIARQALSVTYTGASATATVTVTATTLTLTAAAAVVIQLADYPTITSLVERINSEPGYAAAVLDGNGEKPTLNGLDGVTAGNVKNLVVNVTAHLQAVVDWFNGIGEGFITATRAANAVDVPANIPFTYLAGGSNGNTTNTDWQSAFDVLQATDVQWVVPLSEDPAIHAMTDAHVTYMSNIARLERRSIVGGDTGVTYDNAIAAAKALNSDRTSYTHLGFYDYDAAGNLTLYPAYVMAALLAGAFSGLNPGSALTNRSIKVQGLEQNLRNPTDTDQLINRGVLCVENTNRGYRVVKSITTWLNNSNYNRVEVSVGVAMDYVARAIRTTLDELRGKRGTPAVLSEAVSRTDSMLRQLAQPEPIGPAVIVGDAANPAFKEIVARLDGDVLRVEFQCSPVIPINYVPIVIHAVPYSGIATG